MTTIAYKDGIVGYDGRQTAGDVILSDVVDKCILNQGHYFFLSGHIADYEIFVKAWHGEKIETDINAYGFVYDGSQLWKAGVQDNKLWKYKVTYPESVGSGYLHALTAMDMGATAKEAVEWAAKRDVYTGGVIREFALFHPVPTSD
jgi:20S proteasome alpha/beta subunit